MTDRQPAVSVVIATRNRSQTLARTLESVLGQDYPGLVTAIVVFDQTPRRDVSAPTGPDRRLLVTENLRTPGPAGARNTGLLTAEDPLVAVCEDGDEWHPGKLGAQTALLRASPESALATHGIRIDLDGVVTDRRLPGWRLTFEDFLHDRHLAVHPSTYLARTAQVREQIGLLSEEVVGGYAEDYEWLLRAARVGPVVGLPFPLATVHLRGSSPSAAGWQMIDAALAWLQEQAPEFSQDRVGLAKLQGQRAFSTAAVGDRRLALDRIRATLRTDPRAEQAWAALPVALGLIPADRMLALRRRLGRD